MIRGETLCVLHPCMAESDAHGNVSAEEWEIEEVSNILFDPASTQDLEVARANGVTSAATFHFPKGYEKSLKGCLIERAGVRWRVIGDPQPYLAINTPGGWNLAAECEVCDG